MTPTGRGAPRPVRLLGSIVLLAAWLGAAALLAAVVAPAAFATLPSRALAGAVVARVLPVVFVSGIVVGALVGTLAWGGGASFARTRAVLGGAIVCACAVAEFGVGARIHRLREAIGPSVDALERGDPRRAAFGRLHGLSVALMGAAALAAAAALAVCARAIHSGAES